MARIRLESLQTIMIILLLLHVVSIILPRWVPIAIIARSAKYVMIVVQLVVCESRVSALVKFAASWFVNIVLILLWVIVITTLISISLAIVGVIIAVAVSIVICVIASLALICFLGKSRSYLVKLSVFLISTLSVLAIVFVVVKRTDTTLNFRFILVWSVTFVITIFWTWWAVSQIIWITTLFSIPFFLSFAFFHRLLSLIFWRLD